MKKDKLLLPSWNFSELTVLIVFFGGGCFFLQVGAGPLAKNFFPSSFSLPLLWRHAGIKGWEWPRSSINSGGRGVANLDFFFLILSHNEEEVVFQFSPYQDTSPGGEAGVREGAGPQWSSIEARGWNRWGLKGKWSKGGGRDWFTFYLHSLDKFYCGFKK